LYAVGPDGNVKWHFATPDEIRSTAAVAADGTIIFGCDDHMLYALDPNGSLLWARGTGGHVRTSPTIAPDGTIYFGSSDHCLYALAGTSPLADSPWPMFHHDPQHTGRAR
jgi:outer membrane protein assembly factor BamB